MKARKLKSDILVLLKDPRQEKVERKIKKNRKTRQTEIKKIKKKKKKELPVELSR